MWLLVMIIAGCGLPEQGVQARDDLARALETREPSAVGAVARRAARWQGQDPALDRLLGDALANVLMRPEDGLPLLQDNPAPDDPAWREAAAGAALRAGDEASLSWAWSTLGVTPLPADDLVVDQGVARARHDPAIGWQDVAEVVADCALVDARPGRGRKLLDLPAPAGLPGAARALGASRVAMVRPLGAGESGDGWNCRTGRLVRGDTLPQPTPRSLAVVAQFGDQLVAIDVLRREQGPWALASNQPEAALRWLQATPDDAPTAGQP